MILTTRFFAAMGLSLWVWLYLRSPGWCSESSWYRITAALTTTAGAACLPGGCSQNGLVFSEASDNFKITNVTGKGTTANPFVVHQDVWGLDISLSVSNLPNATQHSLFNRPGFAIKVVSRNLTDAFWRFYDHELQERAGFASSENDGLSFAQGVDFGRPYTSSHYNSADEITDVRDFINFHQGPGVNPGESVQFNYFITDTIPTQQFYIRQRPDYRTQATPTPSSLQHSIVNPAQPVLTPKSVSPKPVTSLPIVTPLIAPTDPLIAQTVPEPSIPTMGILTFLFARAIGRGKHLRQPKQLFAEQT